MDKHTNERLVVVLGPTACGKTSLSVELAKRLDGEIISGDSMQVYRGMDIGTAKIRPHEMQGIPHHLIDICDPTHTFSVAEFRELAMAAVSDINARGKLPILVGGTGLYLAALLRPYNFTPAGSVDPAVRERLKAELAEIGSDAMHKRLAAVDPQAAERIHPNDHHRLLRALEVAETGEKNISQLQEESLPPPAYRKVIIGLAMERELLYQRIEARVDEMFRDGLADEVQRLLAAGVPREASSMQGLGYRQTVRYLDGECTLEEAAEMLKRDTRRFAKRQMTWFKKEEHVDWFQTDHYRDADSFYAAVSTLVVRRLEEDQNERDRIAGAIPECPA